MNTHNKQNDIFNAKTWKDGFQAGYDQVINEMLYWLVETKRKTIPGKWVTSRQTHFYSKQHESLHQLINSEVNTVLERLKENSNLYNAPEIEKEPFYAVLKSDIEALQQEYKEK